MKWLKRCCWLAAWGVWLWLGFGLYRELPRHAGAKVCEAQFEEGERPLGFFDDDRLLATLEVLDDSKGFNVRVRDALRGEVKRRVPAGRIGTYYDQQFSSTHAIVVGGQRADESLPPAALDLHTGKWTDLGPNAAYFKSFHPTKPWALLTQAAHGDFTPKSASVVDLRSGRRLFEWKGDRERQLAQAPIFMAPGDTLLVPVARTKENSKTTEHRVELWTIGTPGPDQVFEGLEFAEEPTVSHTRSVAWPEITYDPDAIRVFDVESGKIVLTHPPNAKPVANLFIVSTGEPQLATISMDGRAVYYRDVLVRVADGTTLWERGSYEWFSRLDERGRFHVQELWEIAFGDWAKGFTTTAVRDLATGQVLCRLWSGDSYPSPIQKTGAAERDPIYVDDKNVIRQWPTANWPLLALCQAFLALPLVISWPVLRWRRKKRARSVSDGSRAAVQP